MAPLLMSSAVHCVLILSPSVFPLSVPPSPSLVSLLVINGLRSPTQPSLSNGGVRIAYSYTISDGVTYSVTTSLTLTTSSAFATSRDQLGNPYQSVLNAIGTRAYTYLPTNTTLVSSITSLANVSSAAAPHGDQRFHPYALLTAPPGVYTINTAPFLDVVAGLSFAVSPPVPLNGQVGAATVTAVSVFVNASTASSIAVLTESASSVNPPLAALQRQSYTILA